ncbi:MAG: alanine--tRNA ligase [Candidatus Aenigmatarchaeota archaeon]
MGKLEELKTQILGEASENPEKFFPVSKLRERGFQRGKCKNCGKYFWSKDKNREVCGEAECSSGYTFIGNSPAERELSYTSVWTEFRDFMEKRGYTPVNRYPVLARWRDDTEFVRASIYDFQPYVVSGEVDPPANPLVIAQPSLRFNDIENVGITGAHYVLHDHIGQHTFQEPGNYDQEKYFEDMLDWIVEGLKIPEEEVVLHEDAWGGGGNLGVSIEFFVGGLELLNQVYMSYEIDDSERGYSELDIKVLDMGMGHERIAWIVQGTETSYQASMPQVIEKLVERTGTEKDRSLWRKFTTHSGELNVDEVEDVKTAWREVAEKIGVTEEELREEIKPTAALYSIADHTRALLFAFVDGALPSNTGEKHSLRVVARRAFDFIDRYKWDISLEEVMEWHAEELKEMFPELKENLDQAKKIIRHEREKYEETKEKAREIIKGLKGKKVDESKLLELYETHGISPELLRRFDVDFEMPKNFYSRVSGEGGEEVEDEEDVELDLSGLPETEKLYLQDEKKVEFEARVLKILEEEGKKYVALDRTCFYPSQGGQISDLGTINGSEVLEAVNEGGTVLHIMKDVDFKEGETVQGEIDSNRRKQLMQHHTATHVINGATTEVLGDHISQAGAKKTEEKARLDITHYKNLDREEIDKIERAARDWVEEGLEVKKTVMEKSEAEKKYGFKIYQGGVPPGNELRIVNIGGGRDVEACGGTHLDNTSEVDDIALVRSTKVQDGVVRLEFKAGEAAREYRDFRDRIKGRLGEWIDTESYTLEKIGGFFDVPIEELESVVERFSQEWEGRKERLEELGGFLGEEIKKYEVRPRDPEKLFEEWKNMRKEIKNLEREVCEDFVDEALGSQKRFVRKEIPVENAGALIRAVKRIAENSDEKAVLLRGGNAVVAGKGSNSERDLVEEVKKEAKVVKEEDGLVKGFDLK